MTTKLKECPFCGKQPKPGLFKADDITGWAVACCAQVWGATETEATEEWNTRHRSPDMDGVEAAAMIAEAYILEPVENERDDARNATAQLIANDIRAHLSGSNAAPGEPSDATKRMAQTLGTEWKRDPKWTPADTNKAALAEFDRLAICAGDADNFSEPVLTRSAFRAIIATLTKKEGA